MKKTNLSLKNSSDQRKRGRDSLRIGITVGDPAGIGPEVALKAAASLHSEQITPVIISRRSVLSEFYNHLIQGFEFKNAAEISGVKQGFGKYIHEIDMELPLPVQGKGSKNTGIESLAYIDEALRLWRAGQIDAIVTGPVSKEFIESTGIKFRGHTEYMADAIGEKNPLMMMFSEKYRVLLVTTHIPVFDIEKHTSQSRILEVIKKGNDSISAIDGKKARIAIAGLDPHCGDNGAIGSFDRDVTAGAASQAREIGIDIDGPLSADTLFMPGKWKNYSLAIAHYHDQGLIPFKALAFDDGVNVTLGLSLTRTSVDHGTAFDIAGKGVASHTSMVRAIELAYRLESFKSY